MHVKPYNILSIELQLRSYQLFKFFVNDISPVELGRGIPRIISKIFNLKVRETRSWHIVEIRTW